MPHRFTDRWLASVTFGAQWEEFTSLHHAADWLAAHGVRVGASTLYAMYYRHRWEGTERATGPQRETLLKESHAACSLKLLGSRATMKLLCASSLQ